MLRLINTQQIQLASIYSLFLAKKFLRSSNYINQNIHNCMLPLSLYYAHRKELNCKFWIASMRFVKKSNYRESLQSPRRRVTSVDASGPQRVYVTRHVTYLRRSHEYRGRSSRTIITSGINEEFLWSSGRASRWTSSSSIEITLGMTL